MTSGVLQLRPRPDANAPDRSWFDRSALDVAPDLLGMRLAYTSREGRVAGRIVETEAYLGPEDLAAHSARGRATARTAVMFGEPGHAYVYLVYGLHHCLNVVCGPGAKPEAVLIRAVAVDEGVELARARRGEAVPEERLASGPGNVCAAFGIDRTLNGADLVIDPTLTLAHGVAPGEVAATRRIGVAYAGEWAERPWRFLVRGDPSVSRR